MKHSIFDITIITAAIFIYSFFGICFLVWFDLQVKYIEEEISYKKSELSKKQILIIGSISLFLSGSTLMLLL